MGLDLSVLGLDTLNIDLMPKINIISVSNLNNELVVLGGGAAAEADEDAVGALRVRDHGRPQERPLRVGSPAAAVQHRIGSHSKV